MHEITLTYHGTVTAKKNSKQIIRNPHTGRPMLISNRRAKKQETDMAWDLLMQAKDGGWQCGEERPYSTFNIEVKIWNKDRRRRDLDNQTTAILDALVSAGIIPDDSCDYLPKISTEYKGIDNEDPRAEIYIKELAWKI